MSTKSYWDEFGMDYAVDVTQGGFELTFHAVKPPTPPAPQVTPTYPVRAAARRLHRPALQARLTPSRQHLLLELASWLLDKRRGVQRKRDGRLHSPWWPRRLTYVTDVPNPRTAVYWPDALTRLRPPPRFRLSPNRGTP